ncbi:gluconate 2-dehydrogenase subunit 3 family protein [Jannaschia sp. S6380]|nr:gluconate 2-dehydrogenase subunit 3 family protein [Jannaschia sp. S6380]
MVDRLIPATGMGSAPLRAGVPTFLDRALRAAHGRGEGTYMQGPFATGTSEQGYQLPLEPHEFYRVALRDLDEWSGAAHGAPFAAMSPGTQDDALRLMQSGQMALASVPSGLFFGTFWFDVCAGYFADPIHGGNRDMAAWRMIGLPGARTDLRRNLPLDERVDLAPVSLVQAMARARRIADMARNLPRTDAVIVGLGWTGAIAAEELTEAGLSVVALERGPAYGQEDFATRRMHDGLTYSVRGALAQPLDRTT